MCARRRLLAPDNNTAGRVRRSPADCRWKEETYCLAAVKLPVTPWTSMSPFIVLGVSSVPLKVRVAWPASQSQLTDLPSTFSGEAAPGLPSALQAGAGAGG